MATSWLYSGLRRILRRLGRRDSSRIRTGGYARKPSLFDSLERRDVLSSATFAPFATIPGQVATAGQPAHVSLNFSAGQVKSGASPSVLVGFYAEAASGSAATPQISEVDLGSMPLSRVVLPKRGGIAPSKSLFFAYIPASATAAQAITVDVVETGKQTGNFTLKAFLPGDVNADGTVDASDLASVKASYGTALSQPNNNPAADFNADGHVGCIDLRLTQLNQGASVAYTPPATPSVAATAATAVATPVVATAPVTAIAPVATIATPVTASVTPVAALATTTTATATTPVYQAPILAYAYPQAAGSVPVAAVPAGATSSAATPVYYYGQPVVQAPGYSQSAPVTSAYYTGATVTPSAGPVQTPATMPVYYSSQAVTQPTANAQASIATPVYYYGQPVAITSGTASAATPLAVYYPGAPAATPSATTAR